MIPATPDIFKIRPEAKVKYEEKFYQLKPVNGYITGILLKHLFYHNIHILGVVLPRCIFGTDVVYILDYIEFS